jgi:hypothetical protein
MFQSEIALKNGGSEINPWRISERSLGITKRMCQSKTALKNEGYEINP